MTQSVPLLRGRPASPGPRGMWSAAGLDEVEALMQRMCTGQRLDRLGRILREHLASGGKRLRARLALGALEALGVDRDAGIGWAAACELLHNATLVHDDLQDGDRFRRGEQAAWVRHGTAQAINAGDLCLMLPYRVIDHVPAEGAVRWELVRSVAAHAEDVVRGQASELDLLGTGRLDWDSYADAVLGKTAALFSLPVYGAALLAGREVDEAERLARAFRSIGLLFQIQDDVLDLFGTKGRRDRGSDIKEGKVSALVVEHLRLHPEDEAWLVDILRRDRADTRDREVDAVIARFEEGGALAAAWQRLWALEDGVAESADLAPHTRLHALAVELVAQALAPVVHTDPLHTERFSR